MKLMYDFIYMYFSGKSLKLTLGSQWTIKTWKKDKNISYQN